MNRGLLLFLVIGFSFSAHTPTFNINNFDKGLTNRFQAAPSANYYSPDSVTLSAVQAGHWGPTGSSLQIEYTCRGQVPAYIEIPVLNHKPLDASDFKFVTFYLRSSENIPCQFSVIYAAEYAATQELIPFQTLQYTIIPKNRFWKKITIPLDKYRKSKLYGLKLSVPVGSGTVYLDEVLLE